MEKWSKVKLGEIAFITSSKRIFAREYQKEGIPFYRGKEIIEKHNGNSVSTELYISKKRYDEIKSKYGVPVPGDILLSSVGTLGVPWLVDEEKFYFKDGNLTWLRCNEKCIPKFLYLWFNSAEAKNQIEVMCIGSTQKALTIDALNKFNVSLPPLEVQKKICNVIYSIMDKIRTNDEINRNLSEQMQAIFGSIFYSEMEKGNKASLGDYLYIKGRIGWKGLKKEEYLSESEYRIINGESLTVTGIDWNKAGYISEERYIESPEIMLQEGDILISKDGTIGKIGYVNKLDKPTSVASGIFVVRNLKPEEVSTVFIYCLLNSDYFKSFIASRTEGSVIPHLYQKDFVTLEIPILSQEQIVLFNSTVVPLFELFFSNQTENIRLAALRDSLLPKLMSGELDVLDLDI